MSPSKARVFRLAASDRAIKVATYRFAERDHCAETFTSVHPSHQALRQLEVPIRFSKKSNLSFCSRRYAVANSTKPLIYEGRPTACLADRAFPSTPAVVVSQR